MNYREIKKLAKEYECSVEDLIALARINDPFYVGSPGEMEKAQWFADLWSRFGYGQGIHIRRVHYQIVSQDPPILKPDGTAYENTEGDWKYLVMAAKLARYLGYVNPEAFVDRRNPDPHLHAQYPSWIDPTPRFGVYSNWGWDVSLPDFPELPSFGVHGYEGNLQPYHIEIWSEKTTVNDVLIPLCQLYEANYVAGAGEMSITAALALVERIEEADRPARIFYVSDFDPAGHGMPVSVARKIEFFLRDRGLDLDIRLQPVALTREQVVAYELPRTPIKETELRKGAFEATFGTGAVELDALEALHPGELAGLMQEAILDYYDTTLDDRLAEQRDALEAILADARKNALADMREDIEDAREEYENLVTEFENRAEVLRGRLRDLYDRVEGKLEGVDIDPGDYPLPKPRLAEEENGTLYDSGRDYFGQLEAYKNYQNGGG